MPMKYDLKNGFTLVELIVAVGLFASVMTIAAGAYLTIIRLNQQAQAIATGIDNVSFALESMTRNIRSGSGYGCGTTSGTDCSSGGTSFIFKDVYANSIIYSLGSGGIQKTINGGSAMNLTDPFVNITALTFYVSGTQSHTTSGDILQPYVTIVVAGTVPAGPGKTRSFTVESSAAWRGSNI